MLPDGPPYEAPGVTWHLLSGSSFRFVRTAYPGWVIVTVVSVLPDETGYGQPPDDTGRTSRYGQTRLGILHRLQMSDEGRADSLESMFPGETRREPL